MAMPLAGDVLRDVAVENGACIRPIELRRTDRETGQAETVLVPCGSTLDSVCPPCAERAKTLRAAAVPGRLAPRGRARHPPGPASEDQKLVDHLRAEAQRDRDQAEAAGQDTADFDELITELDTEITKAGIRGKAAPASRSGGTALPGAARTPRTCPRRKISSRTVGKTYTAPDGKTFRPSLFVTLTCPSYGPVGEDGSTRRPGVLRL